MVNVDDPHLAVKIHKGDLRAMEQLIRKYEDMLYTYALYMTCQEEDARDVLQDTFIKAHATLTGKYDENTCRDLAVKAWLFRITRNSALNKIRSADRRRVNEQKLYQKILHEPPADLDSLTSLSIGKALDRLDRVGRELITLRFIEDLSYAEIGHILGTGEAALRGKIYRALRKLRQIMEDTSHDM